MPTKHANDNKGKAATIRKVVRVRGKRVTLTRKADGTTTATPSPALEWELQASSVTALRSSPYYVSDPADVTPQTFTLAGDFNAGRRGMLEQVKAKACGLTPGESDLRIYCYGGDLLCIELKAEKTPISADQKKRHALLTALGFKVMVIHASTPADMARLVCAAVNERLGIGASAGVGADDEAIAA